VGGAARARAHADAPRGSSCCATDLLRLNLGVFVLHTVQMSMWVAVPAMLVQAGLAKASTGRSICRPWCCRSWPWAAVFHGAQRPAARRLLLGAIGLVLVVQIGLGMLAASGTIPTVWCMAC
jgi:hypothetical protein